MCPQYTQAHIARNLISHKRSKFKVPTKKKVLEFGQT